MKWKSWKKTPNNLDKEYSLTNSVTLSYLSKMSYKHYFIQEKYQDKLNSQGTNFQKDL